MDNPIARARSDSQSIWPGPTANMTIPHPVQSLVSSFYTLVDTHSESAFRAWTDLFTEDGSIEIGKKKKTGRDDLLAERAHSWDKIAKRRHFVKRVYAHNVSDRVVDLVVLGWVDIEVRGNGVEFSQEFAQRFLVVNETGRSEGEDRGETIGEDGHAIQRGTVVRWNIREFQAWIDSAILQKAVTGEQS